MGGDRDHTASKNIYERRDPLPKIEGSSKTSPKTLPQEKDSLEGMGEKER